MTGEVPDPSQMDLLGFQTTMMMEFSNDELPYPNADWQTWAVSLYSRPSFLTVLVPDPYMTEDWKAWANQLRMGTN